VPNSVLFLGRPGVGKTTVIREMARVLADDLHKRVVRQGHPIRLFLHSAWQCRASQARLIKYRARVMCQA
jgi:tRNA uridine 5-carbamoylmethylation protein Kti12